MTCLSVALHTNKDEVVTYFIVSMESQSLTPSYYYLFVSSFLCSSLLFLSFLNLSINLSSFLSFHRYFLNHYLFPSCLKLYFSFFPQSFFFFSFLAIHLSFLFLWYFLLFFPFCLSFLFPRYHLFPGAAGRGQRSRSAQRWHLTGRGFRTLQRGVTMREVSLSWRRAVDTWSRHSASWPWRTPSSPSVALLATTASR